MTNGEEEIDAPCSAGDYVLATKYGDGDPQDHWAVGFFDGITAPHYDPPRYNVVDGEGNQFRGNGFRRVKKISPERGEWILKHTRNIELSGRSVWHFAQCRMSDQEMDEGGSKCGEALLRYIESQGGEVSAEERGSFLRGWEDGLQRAAQIARYYLKHQNFPCWDHASEYERGVIVAAGNIEEAISEEAQGDREEKAAPSEKV